MDAVPLPDLPDWIDPNAAYGNKCEYRKISVTVPQWIYRRLIAESARRKIAGEPNRLMSALMREALMDYLSKLGSESS
ncbi:MAG: hypothetical protein KGN36_17415 [Acidobacteriota bacterium]|nr:hypothetical protein [Acidobacteriota bacterium]